MAWDRFKFDEQKGTNINTWASTFTSATSSSSSAAQPTTEDAMSIEELAASFSKVTVRDTVRAVLTTNNNFDDLCAQLNSVQIRDYRENTLKEADLIAARVEADLKHIANRHGSAASVEVEQQRLMIVHVVQSYIRCLELDIEKWKCQLKLNGKSESDIAAIRIDIPDFIPWLKRKYLAPSYKVEKSQKPKGETIVDQIAFVQLALNYWRSCYSYIREYEKLVGAEPEAIEKKLWQLEQTTIAYSGNFCGDLNRNRLREPSNIDPKTGVPLTVADIQKLIQQQQERSGYTRAAMV